MAMNRYSVYMTLYYYSQYFYKRERGKREREEEENEKVRKQKKKLYKDKRVGNKFNLINLHGLGNMPYIMILKLKKNF